MKLPVCTWNSQVRTNEIDVQGIVNNAQYLAYFDNARTLQLLEYGINWVELSKGGYDLVLVHTDIKFIKPLRAFQPFKVISKAETQGKLRIVFQQSILDKENNTVCKAINIIACIDNRRNKPVTIATLNAFLDESR